MLISTEIRDYAPTQNRYGFDPPTGINDDLGEMKIEKCLKNNTK